MKLPDGFVAMMRKPNPCFLTTLMPDGSPQMTETWVDSDGENVIINTVQTHLKVKNIPSAIPASRWPSATRPTPRATTRSAVAS
jgi:hypothetical protein